MKTDLFISVVAPLENDRNIIEPFLREVSLILRENFTYYEIVLVDNYSTDGTVEAVAALLDILPGLRMIRLSREFDLDVAISAGLDSCIGDFVIVMIPESDPPDLIPELVDRCRRGVGMVTGIQSKIPAKGLVRHLFGGIFHWYTKRFMNLDLIPGMSRFQVFSRQVVNAMTQINDQYRLMRLFSAIIGFKTEPFTYDPLCRSQKSQRKTFWEDLDTASAIITSSSLHPLRFVSALGLIASLLNLLYMVYAILIFFFKKTVAPGWTTLSLQQGGMFFILFLVLTVACEYLGRIRADSLGRPSYWVMDEMNSNVLIEDPSRLNVLHESERQYEPPSEDT